MRYALLRTRSARSPRAPRHLVALVGLLAIGLIASACAGMLRGDRGSRSADAVHRIVSSGRLRVGMSGVQPPLNMRNRKGRLIGLDVDLARALAGAMDLELELVERPFDQLIPGLRAGDYDLVISNLTITPARNAQVAFAGPYLISGATLLTRSELVEELEQDSAIDRADRAFGVLRGSTSEDLLVEAFPNARIVAVEDPAALIPQVQSGELAGIFADLPQVRYMLAQHAGAGLSEVRTPFTTEPIGIALAPDSPLLTNLVQNHLNTLEYTGLLMQLKTYWLYGGKWLSDLSE